MRRRDLELTEDLIVGGNIYANNEILIGKQTIKESVFEPITDGGLMGDVIDIDGNNGNYFDIYLNRPVTRINLPTNLTPGEPVRFQLRQDGVGGRHVVWGDEVENTGLTCTFNKAMGSTCIVYITSGTFDWSKLQSVTARQSHLSFAGFGQNALNIGDIKISSFDESAGTITFEHPFIDDVVDETGTTNVTITYTNNFYFNDENSDNWIGQFPRGVTQFEFYSTSDGAAGLLNRIGVFSNRVHPISKVRFAEELTDDFMNGSDDGLLNWREANGNGTTSVSSADVGATTKGVLYQRLNGGSTADGRTSTTMGSDQFTLEGMRVGIEGVCMFNENALETADVKYYFGWTNSTQWATTVDGAFFEIVADGSTDGYGRVWCVIVKPDGMGNPVRITYDTGIDLPEDEWFSLHIGKPSCDMKIKFILNDVTVYEANVSEIDLTAKVTCGFGSYYDYTGTPLPNHKEWFLDCFNLKYRMSQDRI